MAARLALRAALAALTSFSLSFAEGLAAVVLGVFT